MKPIFNTKSATILSIIVIILFVTVSGYIIKLKFNIASYEQKILTLQNELTVAKYEFDKQNSAVEKFKLDTANSKTRLENELKNITKKYHKKINSLDKNYNSNCDIINKTFKEWAGENDDI